MANLTAQLVQPPGRAYVAYLRRNTDEFYWNPTTSQFSALNLSSANNATKDPFRISYVEDGANPGNYSWSLVVDAFIDGSYTYVSRELVGGANGTEYPDEQVKTVTIANGVVSGSELSAEIIYSINRSIFSFIKRNSDGAFYNAGQDRFELFNSVTSPEATRAPFRVVFTEDPAGTYKWTLDASDFLDGTYTLNTRELSAGLESLVAADYTVTVTKGSVIEGAVLGEVALSQDSGGIDNLRYVTPEGAAIEGASIRVYAREDWEAGNFSLVKGVSYTDALGKWQVAVFVDSGRTYTVVFSKPGYYGPDTVEIVV
jgi:hypothetical protein